MAWMSPARLARMAFLPVIPRRAFPSVAFAALGGRVASVDADRIRVQGRADADRAQRRLCAARNPLGLRHDDPRVRQPLGRGVCRPPGDGPWLPDLRQVLGDQFDRYQAVMQSRQRGRRGRGGAVVIDEPGLVVQMSGHPRAFQGRAYLPAQLPAGLPLDSIR